LTGVDAVGEADFYHILEQYQERTGVTLFIVTHDWDVATYHSTHVLLIDRRLITFGPPREALTEECLRKAYGHLGHSHEMLRARSWRND
jgi:zinc transport system ATP-binding protein